MQQLRLAGIEEFIESVVRKSRNAMSLGRRKRQEREYLEMCRRFSAIATNKEEVAADTFPTAAFTEEDNSSGGAADAGGMVEA